jgi:hypothetical protein
MCVSSDRSCTTSRYCNYYHKWSWSCVKKENTHRKEGGLLYNRRAMIFMIPLPSIIIMLHHPCVTQTGMKKKEYLYCKSAGTRELVKEGRGIWGWWGDVRGQRCTPTLTEDIRSSSGIKERSKSKRKEGRK